MGPAALPWASVIAALAGYLLGSIPFGLVLTRIAGLGDIRAVGSGNIGATNVLRTGRKGLALATLVLDGGKGAAAVLALGAWGAEAGLVAGLAAVLGHNFPLWLRFRGGKGVATTLGVLVAASWPVGLLAGVTWLAVAALTRYSSLAAMLSLAAAPFYAYWLAGGAVAGLAAALALLSLVRHKANIKRLLKGEETKIGKAPGPSGGAAG